MNSIQEYAIAEPSFDLNNPDKVVTWAMIKCDFRDGTMTLPGGFVTTIRQMDMILKMAMSELEYAERKQEFERECNKLRLGMRL